MTARIALVTGVVGGIGAAIAARLAADGAKVIVNDLPGEALEEAAGLLGLPAVSADLGDPESVKSLAQQIGADYGTPHILVNAAGGVRGQVGAPRRTHQGMASATGQFGEFHGQSCFCALRHSADDVYHAFALVLFDHPSDVNVRPGDHSATASGSGGQWAAEDSLDG